MTSIKILFWPLWCYTPGRMPLCSSNMKQTPATETKKGFSTNRWLHNCLECNCQVVFNSFKTYSTHFWCGNLFLFISSRVTVSVTERLCLGSNLLFYRMVSYDTQLCVVLYYIYSIQHVFLIVVLNIFLRDTSAWKIIFAAIKCGAFWLTRCSLWLWLLHHSSSSFFNNASPSVTMYEKTTMQACFILLTLSLCEVLFAQQFPV